MNNKMKKINEIIKSKPVQYIIVACAGLLVGWLLFSPSESPAPATHEGHEMHEGHSHDLVQDETGVWTYYLWSYMYITRSRKEIQYLEDTLVYSTLEVQ